MGQCGIIKPGNRKIAGNREADPVRNRQNARRHIVIARKDRRRADREGQQNFCRRRTAGKVKLPGTDKPRFKRNARPVERAAIAEQPLLARHMVGVADDEADDPVAKVDEVGRHIVGGLNIVHENRGCQRVVGPRRDTHKRNAAPLQFAENRGRIRHRRRQNDPVNMGFVDQAADLCGEGRRPDIGWLGEHPHALFLAPVPDTFLNLVDIIG